MTRRRIITVAAVLAAAACGGDEDDATARDTSLADSIAASVAAARADSAAEAARAGLEAYFEKGPLPAGATRADLRTRLGAPREVQVATEPNRHDASAVDSLHHMVFEQGEATVRSFAGGERVESVTVRDNALLGSAPPVIGVSVAELRERFGEPDGSPEGHFLYRCTTCSELGGDEVVFHLGKGGTVEAVEIRYPVD